MKAGHGGRMEDRYQKYLVVTEGVCVACIRFM